MDENAEKFKKIISKQQDVIVKLHKQINGLSRELNAVKVSIDQINRILNRK